MDGISPSNNKFIDPVKFKNKDLTINGERRARVSLLELRTLWVNTGTLCNLTCKNCYIESSPLNDRLVYISKDEVKFFLDEILERQFSTKDIGFTGGEPFMNPDFIPTLQLTLSRGFRALILTNAMKPMQHQKNPLMKLKNKFGDQLRIRVSVDHYTKNLHESERGDGSWRSMLQGLIWLSINGFNFDVAGRTPWGEGEEMMRSNYGKFFSKYNIDIDHNDPARLVLFPEMDELLDTPEITERCWSILGVDPNDMMCANSRMIVKRKGADRPAVIACTLLPYDQQFELGETLFTSSKSVSLNHPHCSKFCVLGGGSCTKG
ncbi:MAG: radical SAM protein [Rhodospirillaceae bacterium]|nr:radical SAM protein [Rhodospirillaceae bacterium]